MTKNLHEIDKVYSSLNQAIGAEERIKYCLSLIQKTKEMVMNKRDHLTENLVSRSSELINAAEMEIMKLHKTKQSIRFKK